MKMLILTENQVRKVIDGLILEQNESKTESLLVDFGAVWPAGKWKLTNAQIGAINQKLTQITEFINKHKGSKVTIQVEAGESQITNNDREVNPPVKLEPGVLSQKRGDEMVNFLNQYFKALVGKGITADQFPTIPQPKTITGKTPYKDIKDLKDKSKMALYSQEQFVRAVVSAEKQYDCIVGLSVTIGFYTDKSTGAHTCDEAIFELRMNGVSLGEVNLNNSELDIFQGKVDADNARYQKQLDKANNDFNALVKSGQEKERNRDKYLKTYVGEKPAERGITNNIAAQASKNGYQDPKQFLSDISKINDSFAQYGRKSDGRASGSRTQTFTISGEIAKKIIAGAQQKDSIILSIVPLVTSSGKYKLFFNKGSHSETPWVTIVDKNGNELYNQEPNVGMKRGSNAETVLLQTDLCGNPIKK